VTFLAGHWLALLVAVGAVVAAYVWVQVRGRRRAVVRFTNLELLASVAPKRPGWQRHVGAALLALSLASMVVALARPARDVRVPRRRAVVVMAIDVSISMRATDVEPSRIAAAEEAAVDFARSLPPTVRLGLVAFAGTANVLVSPTSDHDAVVRAVRGLELEPSTAIGDAVLVALRAAQAATAQERGRPAPTSIVLMSDGTTNIGTANEEAAAAAVEADVPVTTIAFGTPDGVVENEGQLVPVPVDEVGLADLATATGGGAFTAETAAELQEAYADVSTAVGYTKERREATTAVLAVALVLGLLAAAASLRWSSRLP